MKLLLLGALLMGTLATELKLSARVDEKGYLEVFGTGTFEGQEWMMVEVYCDHMASSGVYEIEPDALRHYARIRPFIHEVFDESDATLVVMTIGDRSGDVLAKGQLTLFLR